MTTQAVPRRLKQFVLKPTVWTTARVREWEQTGIRPPVAVWMPAQTAWFLNSIQGDRLYAGPIT